MGQTGVQIAVASVRNKCPRDKIDTLRIKCIIYESKQGKQTLVRSWPSASIYSMLLPACCLWAPVCPLLSAISGGLFAFACLPVCCFVLFCFGWVDGCGHAAVDI